MTPDIPICRTVQKCRCHRVGKCSGLERDSGFQISNASAQRQGDRLVGDPWLDPLRACVADKQRVSAKEPFEAVRELPCSRQSQLEAKRLSGLMVQLGFQHRKSLRFGQQVLTGYVIGNDPTQGVSVWSQGSDPSSRVLGGRGPLSIIAYFC